ncbi:hypothetical protein IWW48_002130 [Coemansia sp. RSA 1200]|nr:hypothetical protein IWW48_002130 [Coemansia sp. RSA 1200]
MPPKNTLKKNGASIQKKANINPKHTATEANDSKYTPEDAGPRDEWAPPDDEIGVTLSQALRGSRKNRAKCAYPTVIRDHLSETPNGVKIRKQTTAVDNGQKSDDTIYLTSGTGVECTAEHGNGLDVPDSVSADVSSKYLPDDIPNNGDGKPVNISNEQQQNDIFAMFSDADNSNSSNKERTEEHHDIQSKGGTVHNSAEKSANVCAFDDENASSTACGGFIDEESARNYQQILANKRKGESIGRMENTQGVKRDSKGKSKQENPLEASPSNVLSDSDSSSDSSFVKVRHGRSLRPCLLHESDSEAAEEPDVLDKRRILGHRLRSSIKPKNSSLSRYEQARLKAQHSVGDSETENSDLDLESAVDDTQEGVVNGDTNIDEYNFQVGQPNADILQTDSETERMPRKSVLVIHDSSGESDNDFISEIEEPYSAKEQSASNDKLKTFLSAVDPKRRMQMRRKMEAKRDLGNRSEALNLDNHRSPQYPAKAVKGYSDDLDDDLADFIVDDEDATDGNDSGLEIVNGNVQPILSSEGRNPKRHGTSDDDLLPCLSLEQPREDAVMAQIPEEFSQFDLPTSFKTYVQYLVYWLCNGRHKPELSAKNARYFFFAYVTVARVIDSVEQSLVESSAWVEDFRRDLHSYPEIHFLRIAGIEGCDACHFHKNRTATFCLGLLGESYNRDMLIPPRPGESVGVKTSDLLNDEESSMDSPMVVSDEDDSDIRTEFQHDKKRSVVEYNIGKICKQRAEIGHELHHYFYHLALLVEISLSTISLQRQDDGHSVEDDWMHSEPEDLVDKLDSEGSIDRLFAEFKELLSRSKSGFAS